MQLLMEWGGVTTALAKAFAKRRGASGIEYGLLVGLLAVGVMAAVSGTGRSVSALLCVVSNSLSNVTGLTGSGCGQVASLPAAPVAGGYPTGTGTVGVGANLAPTLLGLSSGSGISINNISALSGGTISPTSGPYTTLTFTPTTVGTDGFSYTVIDSYGQVSNAAAVTITAVANPNCGTAAVSTTLTTVPTTAAALCATGSTASAVSADNANGTWSWTCGGAACTATPASTTDNCAGIYNLNHAGAACYRAESGSLQRVLVTSVGYIWPSDEGTLLWSTGGTITHPTGCKADGKVDWLTSTSGTALTADEKACADIDGPYPAAAACYQHGSDWYLPNVTEIVTVLSALAPGNNGGYGFYKIVGTPTENADCKAVGTVTTCPGLYWSSQEAQYNGANSGQYNSGWKASGGTEKFAAGSVRCIRQ